MDAKINTLLSPHLMKQPCRPLLDEVNRPGGKGDVMSRAERRRQHAEKKALSRSNPKAQAAQHSKD
jgi:hypothetical protein